MPRLAMQWEGSQMNYKQEINTLLAETVAMQAVLVKVLSQLRAGSIKSCVASAALVLTILVNSENGGTPSHSFYLCFSLKF